MYSYGTWSEDIGWMSVAQGGDRPLFLSFILPETLNFTKDVKFIISLKGQLLTFAHKLCILGLF